MVGYSFPKYVTQNTNPVNLEKRDGMDGSMIKYYIVQSFCSKLAALRSPLLKTKAQHYSTAFPILINQRTFSRVAPINNVGNQFWENKLYNLNGTK